MKQINLARAVALAVAAGLAKSVMAAQPQAAAGVAEAGAMANPGAVYELPTIDVVSTAPLPGIGVPLNQVPSNVQTLGNRDLDGRGYDNLSDALNGGLGSVTVNDTQSNPYQLDVNVRGFKASPNLGTPQGLSVFVDGVRVNETFGDVVNWDLIPQNAIANITLMPGANPQFGLNTLGGALSVITKSGFQFPGTQVSVDTGSARRRQFQLESGGHGDSVDYFVAANLYRDSGWADSNPSSVKQLFAKTGYQDDDTDVDLSLTLVDNTLNGNQTLPLSFLDNLHQIYTGPDYSENKLTQVNLKGSQFFGKDVLLSGGVYYRRVVTSIFNSNTNGNYGDPAQVDLNGLPCAGQTPFLPDCPNAQNVTDSIRQNTVGVSTQLADTARWWGHDNSITVGFSFDRGRTDFSQGNQSALAAADRTTLSTAPIVAQVGVNGGTDYTGLYVMDTFTAREDLALTVSGRYNRARVNTQYSYYNPANFSIPPEGGDYTYTRFNPSVGLNFNPGKTLSTYVSYTEGMRAPTPIELTCASPTDPCALPVSFSTDPYLKMVVSRTLELGARGEWPGLVSWSAAVFQTRLQDDIQFIASSSTQGYFSNVGDTQRRGLELGLARRTGHWDLGAHYTLLDATFQSPLAVLSNSSAADPVSGLLIVPRGAQLPGLPRHVLKLQAHYAEGVQWSIGGNLLTQTSTYAFGDTANNDVNGKVPGYAVVNLDAHYALQPQLELSLVVHNLFNRVYSSVGLLAVNQFNQPGHTFDVTGQGQTEQFRSIGAPRLGFVSLTWWFDKPAQPGARVGQGTDRD